MVPATSSRDFGTEYKISPPLIDTWSTLGSTMDPYADHVG
jgi:hypothetical protein